METLVRVLFCGKNYKQGLKSIDKSSFLGAAKLLGWEIASSLEDLPSQVICVDYQKSDRQTIRKARELGIPTVLVVNEPEVVIPEHQNQSILGMFDKVLRVGRPNESGFLPWPQTWSLLEHATERLNRGVIVNADKWSFIQGQLYWLRAAVASNSTEIDVFGPGWERNDVVRLAYRFYELVLAVLARGKLSFFGLRHVLSRPQNYLGRSEDKIQDMCNYRIAVVIENSSTYISEKLFDAWFAGCIPIYVGPSLRSLGLCEDFAIECKPTVEGIARGMNIALKLDYRKFQDNLQKYLKSQELVERWSAKNALTAVLLKAIID